MARPEAYQTLKTACSRSRLQRLVRRTRNHACKYQNNTFITVNSSSRRVLIVNVFCEIQELFISTKRFDKERCLAKFLEANAI